MNVIRKPSPNFHVRTMRPTHVVMHIAEGSLSACDAWLTNPQSNASAHYAVGKDGSIHQYVNEADAAWANGAVREPRIPLPCDANPNEWTISLEHEGYSSEPWTDAMYAADAWLLRGISERWGIPLDRQHVIGHCDIDSVARANCPGTGLDWDRLLREAKGVSMNSALVKLLAERKPSRRGVHGTGNAYDSADYYRQQIPEMKACGIDWLKLVVAGDSGVQTCKLLVQAGIIPIVRPYNTACPANTIDRGFLQPYLDVGVQLFESPFNEFYAPFENTWPGGDLPADWPQQVARGWAQFATIVLAAGGVPTTPSIETWHYDRIFVPLFGVLCADYADLLRDSIVAMHNRTLNHPVAYSADPGGFLGWTWMNDFLVKRVGGVPMLATEAGPEPGWSQDANYPRVTPELHAQMVRDILKWPTPDYYLADCMWLWEGSGAWAGASWKRNSQHMGGADLPVVQMLKDWQPDVPEPDFPPEPDVALDDAIRAAVKSVLGWETYPWLTKVAALAGDLREPLTDELLVQHGGVTYRCRAFGSRIWCCKDGQYMDGETFSVNLFEEIE